MIDACVVLFSWKLQGNFTTKSKIAPRLINCLKIGLKEEAGLTTLTHFQVDFPLGPGSQC